MIRAANYPNFDPSDYGSSLLPGKRTNVTADIFQPLSVFVEVNDIPTIRTTFPGMDRHLVWTGDAFENRGVHVLPYDYYDDHTEELTRPGNAPAIENLDEYGDTLTARYLAYDATAKGVEPWLADFTRRSVAVEIPYRQMHLRAFYAFMMADTLFVSDSLNTRVRAQINDPENFNVPAYVDLWRVDVHYQAELRGEHKWPQKDRAITQWIIDSFPFSGKQYDAIASMLYNQLHEERMYEGKEENMESMLEVLPNDYRAKLDRVAAELEAERATDDGDQVFLAHELVDLDGGRTTANAARRKPNTLFKFWFAGCKPCIMQQPAEAQLLQDYPDLEIVYVAFKTRKDIIPDYLAKHQPPTDRHLYLPMEETAVMRAATGRAAAPTYLLVMGEEVVCRNCPNPSDASLEEMLQ